MDIMNLKILIILNSSKLNSIKYKLFTVFVFLSILIINVHAQHTISLDDALKMALENNYAIKIAKNDAATSKNNNRMGAAGMLPSVFGSAGQDNQIQDTKQKFLSGSENNKDGAKSSNLNAGVELGWTIFDGMKMFATRNRLKELQDIGELKMRSQIELTFSKVIKAYMDVVLAKQQLALYTETLLRSQKRYEFAEEKFKAGKSPKTELLQAQVDLNTDRSSKIRQETILKNSKALLNQLLAIEVNTEFDVNEIIQLKTEIKLEDIQQKAVSQNVGLQIVKKNQNISLLNIKEVQAERMPSLQIKSGYNFSRSQSEAGFLQSSQSLGFHYGAGLSINLFNGYDVNRRLINNRLAFRSSEWIYKDSLGKVQSAVAQTWNNYQGSLQLLTFEKQNIQVAEENYSIAEEQYKLGVITSIELRSAQINLINSKTRLLSVQNEAKMSETELLRLSGELLK